jgi:hypothetical protein
VENVWKYSSGEEEKFCNKGGGFDSKGILYVASGKGIHSSRPPISRLMISVSHTEYRLSVEPKYLVWHSDKTSC